MLPTPGPVVSTVTSVMPAPTKMSSTTSLPTIPSLLRVKVTIYIDNAMRPPHFKFANNFLLFVTKTSWPIEIQYKLGLMARIARTEKLVNSSALNLVKLLSIFSQV